MEFGVVETKNMTPYFGDHWTKVQIYTLWPCLVSRWRHRHALIAQLTLVEVGATNVMHECIMTIKIEIQGGGFPGSGFDNHWLSSGPSGLSQLSIGYGQLEWHYPVEYRSLEGALTLRGSGWREYGWLDERVSIQAAREDNLGNRGGPRSECLMRGAT